VRSAIVELDTTTLKLLIVDDKLNSVVDLRRSVRAGSRYLETCREYRAAIDANDVGATHAIALSDASDVVGSAEQILGARVEILTMEREAELLALAVSRTFPELAETHCLVVDVGDSSTWIIDVVGGCATTSTNLPIGAAQLTARYLRHDPSTGAEQNAVERAIDKALKPVELPKGVAVVGTSTTAATIGALQLEDDDPTHVTGLRVAHRFVVSWSMRLARTPLAARKQLPGIDVERADVIAGGVAIYARSMTWVNAAELVTSDRGFRWGVAFEHAKKPAR
jgi:exopolyphosphatase/guanosine-5'-triphosphate,3'-diphosphate pyrophosphatase